MTEQLDPHVRARAIMEGTTRDLSYPPSPEALTVAVYTMLPPSTTLGAAERVMVLVSRTELELMV